MSKPRPDTLRRRMDIARHVAAGRKRAEISRLIGVSGVSIWQHFKAMGFVDVAAYERVQAAKAYLADASEVEYEPAKYAKPDKDSKTPRGSSSRVPPYPTPPAGCRYYLTTKRRTCGARKTSAHYCAACLERVSPTAKLPTC